MKNLKQQLNLSADALREVRVCNFCETAEANAKMLISEQECKIRNLKSKRENILDLGDDSTTAIAQKITRINSRELMEDVFEIGYEIRMEEIKLASMKNDYNILFGDVQQQSSETQIITI